MVLQVLCRFCWVKYPVEMVNITGRFGGVCYLLLQSPLQLWTLLG